MPPPPWNDSSILPPPVNMFLSDKKVDVSALKYVCNTMIEVLSKQLPLHKESALCSRLVYKYAWKFRNDIGFRYLRKTYTALKKYLRLNFLKDIQNFLMALPSESDDEKYLPTKQMLEYVMLRIITFSMIMLRICVCSKQAAIFYLDRIKRAESHWMSLLPYAMISRIWSLSMVLLQHSITWYSNLYPFLNILELKGLSFLPDTYVLPEDLKEWLDLENIDCFGKFNWKQTKSVEIDYTLLDEDENDLISKILNYTNMLTTTESEQVDEEWKSILHGCKDQIISTNVTPNEDQGEKLSREKFNKEQADQGKKPPREKLKKDQEDQGEKLSREKFKKVQEVLSRESFEHNRETLSKETFKVLNTQNTVCDEDKEPTNQIDENNDHTYKNITNSKSLKQFIDKEESYRNECDNRSLTGHLSLMQWHALKKVLLKLCNELTNRKIERKFQRIWKERCLDYK